MAKRRPGPVGPCEDATLLEHIKKAIAESRFTGEGYRKVRARLRFAGIRTSPRRVRRLMGENGLLAPHRLRTRPDRLHDGTITTEAVDVLAPEGNGCAERFIRTLKENPQWVRTFDTVEELRTELLDFQETCSTTWIVERHG